MSTTGTLLTLSQSAPPRPSNVDDAGTPVAAVRRISSHRLLAGERELVIQHMGSEYHLRLTRNGKLILTK
ncbi:hemin uptake protein HemP [Dyella humi]|uniref:Hemin uptake protein HemP n=1 Tax=Dyella humi TaxID=1770547 RepID=A0ABW8IMI8_9GAMM